MATEQEILALIQEYEKDNKYLQGLIDAVTGKGEITKAEKREIITNTVRIRGNNVVIEDLRGKLIHRDSPVITPEYTVMPEYLVTAIQNGKTTYFESFEGLHPWFVKDISRAYPYKTLEEAETLQQYMQSRYPEVTYKVEISPLPPRQAL